MIPVPNVDMNRSDNGVNRGSIMDEVSKITTTIKEIALKVLKSIVAILVTTAICTLMAISIAGLHPIVTPIGIIMGLGQGILLAHKIWEE
ncbi:hypothetical protein EB008_02635 [bacterium]|jgi:hypothetical protein|nr:hypothetical protein [bacterium]